MFARLSSRDVRLLTVVGLVIPCLLLIAAVFVAYRSQAELDDSFQWVAQTTQAQHQLQQLVNTLTEAETGQRGYLLFSKESYLEPYQVALTCVSDQMANLRGLTADNPVQADNLRQLKYMVAHMLDYMAETISFARGHSHDETLAVIANDRGQQMMEEIRERTEAMDREESGLLVARQHHLASRARMNTAVLCSLLMLNVIFAGTLFFVWRRLLKLQSFVTVCAWSGMVDYRGEWLSFDEYLRQRFGLNINHGISPSELQKVMTKLEDAKSAA
jgi:CHASE3 domain sensor protein